ncbi:hypothetical protein D3C72_1311910 [compost metagenome]
MDGIADRVVVGAQVILADRTDHHFPGMDTYPDLQGDALLQTDPVTMAAHGLLHAKCRKQRPQSMVFVGDRRAEKGQDAIAEGFGHIPLIVMHSFHHQRHNRVDQAAGFFRVQVLDQRRRAGHVSKQRRNRLALAGCVCSLRLHGLPLCADPFGQMGRRVKNRCGDGRRWRRAIEWRCNRIRQDRTA